MKTSFFCKFFSILLLCIFLPTVAHAKKGLNIALPKGFIRGAAHEMSKKETYSGQDHIEILIFIAIAAIYIIKQNIKRK